MASPKESKPAPEKETADRTETGAADPLTVLHEAHHDYFQALSGVDRALGRARQDAQVAYHKAVSSAQQDVFERLSEAYRRASDALADAPNEPEKAREQLTALEQEYAEAVHEAQETCQGRLQDASEAIARAAESARDAAQAGAEDALQAYLARLEKVVSGLGSDDEAPATLYALGQSAAQVAGYAQAARTGPDS